MHWERIKLARKEQEKNGGERTLELQNQSS
jgi:hypothetical protein